VIRLTDAEKEARGTRRKGRDVAPRPLKQIRADIREHRQSLKDMRVASKLAGESIRLDGIWLVVTVYGKGGEPCESKKANPAFAIKNKALSTIKVLQRSLVLLAEELELATAAKNATDDFEEFA
jgi:hypothetical protein